MDMLAVAVLTLELVDKTEVERSLRAVSHTDGLSPLWETYQTYQSPEVSFFWARLSTRHRAELCFRRIWVTRAY